MRNNKQVFWGHGLFLRPQHFQQQDLFHQGNLHYFWRLVQPFGWGIRTIQIREEGLAAGMFEVLHCEVVMQSGWILRAGPDAENPNASLPARTFARLIDPSKGPVSVFVGLPKRRRDRSNLASDPSDKMPSRFGIRRDSTTDLFEPENQAVEIDLIEHNLTVVFDQEPGFNNFKDALELVKVGELLLMPDSQYAQLAKDYIFPCLTVRSSHVLLNRLKDLRDLLIARGNEFAEIRRQRGVRATATVAQDAIGIHMLQTLSRHVPVLQHLLEVGQIHPEPLYGVLRQMVGELSVFSEEIGILGSHTGAGAQAGDLPPYNHENIWLCFDMAIACLSEMVRSMTLMPAAGIRLTHEGEYYRAQLPASFFEGERTSYYLMIDSAVRGDELQARLNRIGKITAIEGMPRIRQAHLFGLRIDPLPFAPEALPQKGARCSYFAIETQDPTWKYIRDQGNIAIFCDLPPDDTIIKLFAVRDE